ncbi:hypothetical protein BKA67DRAFT_655392 [Truncatella angustata]|uniref:Uncharacterized protein n=1 Tax=Truncatella angustata TaxID=152316 RepID=A0A9P8URG1_9PEZI|nr:uncharacterized protein BKA67DRAFT_655392 [Truncatella angustata]KAH6657102.1 hypothetical protein BKA67DRAFT_655392 [Truncatella angustata]
MKPAHIAILASCSTVNALWLPQAIGSTVQPTYSWNATSWQCGLSHGNPAAAQSGWYAFTVSAGEATGEDIIIPAFSASCQGSATGFPLVSEFANCTINSSPANSVVLARVYAADDGTQCHIAISYLVDGKYVMTPFTEYWNLAPEEVT